VIGELDHIRSYAGYSATGHNQPWVHDADTVGGGALRDNGVHLIDLTRWFLGEVAEVKGFATDHVWQFPGCEDNGFALLRSGAGRIATVQASWTEWRRYQFRVEIYGSLGCIRASCFPMMLEVVTSAEPGGATQRKRDWFPSWVIGEKLKSYRWVVVKSFVTEFEAFAAALGGARTPLATGLDGLRAIEIAQAAVDGGARWDAPAAAPAREVAR
jgi:predicted dehydrogenase